jgi:NAD(P)-dependent dehydrogenase (short-subunit alcohol dehydrogenase family)
MADGNGMRFEGKTAIVTGGSRGIGRGIAEHLLAEGAEVMITGRDQNVLERTATEIASDNRVVIPIAGDISEEQHREDLTDAAMERWGRIDALFNNAAFAAAETFLEVSLSHWDRMIACALTAPFALSQRVSRHMVKAGRGVIVNITSVSAHGANGEVSYSAAKTGLLALTRDIAAELGPAGIRCVAVSPGLVDTRMMEEYFSPAVMDGLRKDSFDRAPLGRVIKVAEVAETCLFAASDQASGVTGCEILVDGGLINSLHIAPTLTFSS